MIRSHELLYDYQIIDSKTLTKLLDLSPLPFMASINQSTSKINIWKVSNLLIFGVLNGHFSTVCDISYARSAQILISSSYDGTVKFWNPVSTQCLVTLLLEGYRKIKIEVSYDSLIFIREGAEKIVNDYPMLISCDIHDRKCKKLKNSGTQNNFITELINLSPESKRIAYVLGGSIVIFNLELEFIVKTLKEEEKCAVLNIKHFKRDSTNSENEFIVSANNLNHLKVWNVFKAHVVFKMQINQNFGTINQIQMIPKFDFNLSIVATSKGEILIINFKEKKIEHEIRNFCEENSQIWALLYFNEPNKMFATGKQGKFKGFQIKFH